MNFFKNSVIQEIERKYKYQYQHRIILLILDPKLQYHVCATTIEPFPNLTSSPPLQQHRTIPSLSFILFNNDQIPSIDPSRISTKRILNLGFSLFPFIPILNQ